MLFQQWSMTCRLDKIVSAIWFPSKWRAGITNGHELCLDVRANILAISELGLHVLADIQDLIPNRLRALEPAPCMSAEMEAEFHPSSPYIYDTCWILSVIYLLSTQCKMGRMELWVRSSVTANSLYWEKSFLMNTVLFKYFFLLHCHLILRIQRLHTPAVGKVKCWLSSTVTVGFTWFEWNSVYNAHLVQYILNH